MMTSIYCNLFVRAINWEKNIRPIYIYIFKKTITPIAIYGSVYNHTDVLLISMIHNKGTDLRFIASGLKTKEEKHAQSKYCKPIHSCLNASGWYLKNTAPRGNTPSENLLHYRIGLLIR